MSETTISVTIDEETKREAEAALAQVGLTTTEFAARLIGMIGRLRDSPVAMVVMNEALREGIRADMLHAALEGLAEDKTLRPVLVDVLKGPPPLKPNAVTVKAIRAARRGEFVGEFKTVEELRAYLNSHAVD